MLDRYADRFDPATFEDDVPVGVTFGSHEAVIPEQLFARAQAVAAGYRLHLLPSLNYYEDPRLSRLQAEGLATEVAFVAAVVNDPLLAEHLDRLREVALACARQSGPERPLVIEGP